MKILILLCVVIFLFAVYVWYLEETAIFIPSGEIMETPKRAGLNFEDIYFQAEDGVTLNGWFIKNPQARSTIIFFHGNAGNIGDRVEKVALLHKLGLNVFIIDYRGYGRSRGRSSEKGMYKDAVAAFDYLLTRGDIDKEKIVAYGVSLGGAAAIELAKRRRIAAVVIDSSFPRAVDMARILYPFVPSFMIRTKMDSLSKIKTITVPKLFIHSRDDEIVPFALGQKLYDAASLPKEFLEIYGAHNEGYLLDSRKYWGKMSDFLQANNLL
ncbi:MAG: alpha/beta hydrolase [Candidatus Omnitrophota bacterium]